MCRVHPILELDDYNLWRRIIQRPSRPAPPQPIWVLQFALGQVLPGFVVLMLKWALLGLAINYLGSKSSAHDFTGNVIKSFANHCVWRSCNYFLRKFFHAVIYHILNRVDPLHTLVVEVIGHRPQAVMGYLIYTITAGRLAGIAGLRSSN